MRERQSRARARALAAGIVAGLALWCTRGGLEVVAGPAGPLRVALLPSGWQALSLIAAMAGAALGLAHAVAWAGGGDARAITDDDADVTRPLFASGVLVLPFLPWLADAWPALTVLGGRFALLVWFVVGALTLRAAVLRIRAARRYHTTVFGPVAAVVALAGLLLYGGVAWRFAGSGLFPGGDEPHYLVLAQSLWRDHDFKIENNHARGDTLEYFRLPLQPHYLERGRDGEIYSIHPVGLAIVAAPIYAAGGYYGVVAFLVCCAAGAAAGLWLAALRLTGSATRRDPGVGRRRRQRAVRLQQHHRLSRDPGRGVRHGRLPDRHAARRPRPAPRTGRGVRHGAGPAALAEQQVRADDGRARRARAGPPVAAR